MLFKHSLLLASKSPRRRDLLGNLGFPVEIIDQFSDEIYPLELEKEKIAQYLAQKKSNSVTQVLNENQILVCADTIVVLNNIVFEKPKDADEAILMLTQLSGKTHTVYTGVCLRSNTKTEIFTCSTEVSFLELSQEQIKYYVNTNNPFDKAGSYGIQDWLGYIGVKEIKGCYFNVMGLPLSLLNHKLTTFSR